MTGAAPAPAYIKEQAIELHQEGWTATAIAHETGYTKSAVARWIRRWKNNPDDTSWYHGPAYVRRESLPEPSDLADECTRDGQRTVARRYKCHIDTIRDRLRDSGYYYDRTTGAFTRSATGQHSDEALLKATMERWQSWPAFRPVNTPACREAPSLLFDTDNDDERLSSRAMAVRENAALEYCDMCPARNECLDYAITYKIEHGIWGGMTPEQRQIIVRRTAA